MILKYMQIIKNISLILILLICTYLGINKSRSFQKREIELKKIKNALNIFKTKICYTYETIGEIFTEISKLEYQKEENIFQKTVDLIDKDGLGTSWNKSIDNIKNYFNEDDKEILKMLGKTLGKTDKEGQISEIELVSSFLNKEILDAEEVRSKNEKMYKTLGITIGLTLVIIFI